MSFKDGKYPNRKDRRRPRRGSARFDPACRHGGRCDWCRGNRTRSTERRKAEADARRESD